MTPEEYNQLPSFVTNILDTWDENEDLYAECRRINQELIAIGWEGDWDLSGEIISVMPLTVDQS